MKTIIKLIFSLAFILLIMGCPKDDTGPSDEGTPDVTLYTNPTDPILLKVETTNGDAITYYGEKDRETGVALSLDAYSVLALGETEETFVYLDEEGRTKQIYSPNGVVFNIEWVSETDIRIEAISPEGDIQVSIPINLEESEKESEIVQHDNFTNIRKDKKTQLSITPIQSVDNNEKDVEETQGTVNFYVKQCDYQVLNANITVRFMPNTVLNENYGVMQNLGNGNYKLETPNHLAIAQVDLKPMCTALMEILNYACHAQSGLSFYAKAAICTKITAEITAVFPNVASAAIIAASCGTAFAASEIYCSFVHDDMGGGTSIDSWFCGKLVEVFNIPPTEFQMKAYINIPGVPSTTTDWMNYTGGNSYILTVPPKLRIANFKTTPSDPSPGQGYNATAVVLCPATEGTQVKISIVGTDGYTNSNTTTISENSDVSLYVPGAEAGVRDVITIQCLGGGPKKEISIVF